MIPNRKIPAVGKASYGRDFLFFCMTIFAQNIENNRDF
jgi:hypothetical protein